MPLPTPTTGLGVSTSVGTPATNVSLSLSGVNIYQIAPTLTDVSGTAKNGVVLTLSAAATASGGVTAYTGTITGGAANAFVGAEFIVAGFVTAANNGTFVCTASTATTLTLANTGGVAETHAGTATQEGSVAFAYVSRNTLVATVSATGVITGVTKGGVVVEVSYPAFDNSVGKTVDGSYALKIYKEISVVVTS